MAATATPVNHKRAVREYLLALERASEPIPHAMRRDQDWYQGRINTLTQRYGETPDVIDRLKIAGKIVELEAKAQAKFEWDRDHDPASYEDAFVESAAIFARAHKVSYEAFRSVGVPAEILTRAKVPKLKELL